MKYSLMPIAFCLYLSLCVANVAHADGHMKTNMSPDEQAIAYFMNKDMAEAWKSNKPGTVLELFSDSAPVVWYNNMTQKAVVSKDEKEKDLKAFFAKHKVLDFMASDIRITKVDDNMGFVTCTQKMLLDNVKNNAQGEVVMQTIYEVAKGKDGKWNAVREMTFMGDAVN